MSLVLGLSFFTSFLLFFIRSEKISRWFSLLASLVISAASFYLLFTATGDEVITFSWLPRLGINFTLGLSGITPIMIALAGVVVPLILISTFHVPLRRTSYFLSLFHLIQAALFGVFMARDGFLFYFFWEMVVIPSFFMILIWGKEHRVRHAIVFLLYSLASSFILLGVLVFLYVHTPIPHQFAIHHLLGAASSGTIGSWFFWALCISFGIKIPLIPFHRWQPGAYVSLPTPGSMLLGALVSKMGIYAIIQFAVPVTSLSARPFVLGFCIVSVLYASVLALTQTHFKSMIAYLSIAHSSLIVAGLFSLTPQGTQGAVVQLVFHSVLVVGLFLLDSVASRWSQTHILSEMGGLGHHSLYFRKCFFLIVLGAISLPLTGGFVGEFLILWGISLSSPVLAALAGLSIILGAWVMLNVYQHIILGPERTYTHGHSLALGEKIVLGVVGFIIFALGIFPACGGILL